MVRSRIGSEAPRSGRSRTAVARLLAILLLALGGARLQAQEMDTPLSLHLPTLLKVLTYDRSNRTASGSEIVIGVAFQSRNRQSMDVRDEFLTSVTSAAAAAFPGMTIRRVPVDLDGDDADVAALLRGSGMRALYVTPLRAYDVRNLVTLARGAKVTTISGVSSYARQGVAVAIGVLDDRPRIIVNLASARAAGADYPANLLGIATVIR